MKFKTSRVILLALVIVAVTAALVYTRPMTVEELYPALKLDECTRLEAYYFRYAEGNKDSGRISEPVVFSRSDGSFDELLSLFEGRRFSRSLVNLISNNTSKIHRYEEGDFMWEVYFWFENVEYSDGSVGSGTLLSIKNYFGELELRHDADILRCSTSGADEFYNGVMALIEKKTA